MATVLLDLVQPPFEAEEALFEAVDATLAGITALLGEHLLQTDADALDLLVEAFAGALGSDLRRFRAGAHRRNARGDGGRNRRAKRGAPASGGGYRSSTKSR